MKAQIHLQRKSLKGYKNGIGTQRLTYDLTRQTPGSITELNQVMKHFAARSRGEFEYWITDENNDMLYSSDDPECVELRNEFEKEFL